MGPCIEVELVEQLDSDERSALETTGDLISEETRICQKKVKARCFAKVGLEMADFRVCNGISCMLRRGSEAEEIERNEKGQNPP